jgi:transcription initiation factor TFIIIB Brf1 subunit/transcription initiation factor TFIIB
MKDKIKQLLREAFRQNITCRNCGWSWKESESDKEDLYVCHKCGLIIQRKNQLMRQ